MTEKDFLKKGPFAIVNDSISGGAATWIAPPTSIIPLTLKKFNKTNLAHLKLIVEVLNAAYYREHPKKEPKQ